MTAAMRAVADGLRDLFDTPGLLFLSLLHTTVASVVFGLALGVAGGVTTALEVLEDAESSGLVAARILDPAVTTDLHPRAVDTVSRAFAAHVDGVDPRAFLVTDAIGIEDPRLQGAVIATPGLAREFGATAAVSPAAGVYFAPTAITSGGPGGTVYVGSTPHSYAGPLPADAAAPRADGSLWPLGESPVIVTSTTTMAGLIEPVQLAAVFGSVVARQDAASEVRAALDVLEDETGVVAELAPIASARPPIAREARGAALMVTAYTAGLASAVVTVVSLLTTMTRRLTPTWLAHLTVGAPRRLIRLRIATSVAAVWGIPAVLGSLLGLGIASEAGGLRPAPAVVVVGLAVVLAISAACTRHPLRQLHRAVRTAALVERTV